jgi:hypothetical protein
LAACGNFGCFYVLFWRPAGTTGEGNLSPGLYLSICLFARSCLGAARPRCIVAPGVPLERTPPARLLLDFLNNKPSNFPWKWATGPPASAGAHSRAAACAAAAAIGTRRFALTSASCSTAADGLPRAPSEARARKATQEDRKKASPAGDYPGEDYLRERTQKEISTTGPPLPMMAMAMAMAMADDGPLSWGFSPPIWYQHRSGFRCTLLFHAGSLRSWLVPLWWVCTSSMDSHTREGNAGHFTPKVLPCAHARGT